MEAVKVSVVAILVLGFVASSTASVGNLCYSYQDHAAKYKLDHVAYSYPWDEVNFAMSQNPQLTDVLATGTAVPTSRPSDALYYQPVSVICPSDRYMLKAFQVDNKDCYVIEPGLQQVRYTRCGNQSNHDCHHCSYGQAGISKCVEDYEWLTVWAYCRPILPKPNPRPVVPPGPLPQPYPTTTPVYPQPRPYTQPTPYPHPRPYPQPRPYYALPYPPAAGYPSFLHAKFYYDPYAQQHNKQRLWKRSLLHITGKVEQICLYLPYQCSCRNYKC